MTKSTPAFRWKEIWASTSSAWSRVRSAITSFTATPSLLVFGIRILGPESQQPGRSEQDERRCDRDGVLDHGIEPERREDDHSQCGKCERDCDPDPSRTPPDESDEADEEPENRARVPARHLVQS